MRLKSSNAEFEVDLNDIIVLKNIHSTIKQQQTNIQRLLDGPCQSNTYVTRSKIYLDRAKQRLNLTLKDIDDTVIEFQKVWEDYSSKDLA